MIAGVYAIANALTGCRYVGSSVNIKERWAGHRRLLRKGAHHSTKLQSAWDRDGEAAFDVVVLVQCAPDKDALLLYEGIAMRAFDVAKTGYNMAIKPGSRLGAPQRPEAVAKTAAANRGHTWNLGRKHSAETKRQMSANQLGHVQPAWTAEQRQRYDESRKNPEFRARLSASLQGNKNGVGHKVSARVIAAMQEGRARQRAAARAAKVGG